MLSNNNTSVTLKTQFGKYATLEVVPQDSLQNVISQLQEICGPSMTVKNFRLNGKHVDKSEKIFELFRKGNMFPKFSNKTLCRLCAQNSKYLVDIFSSNTDYSEMIRTCLSIEVDRSDKLPIKLCKNCIGTLTEFYKFKQKTTEAELKLKYYFKCSTALASSITTAPVTLDSNELFQNSEVDANDYLNDVTNDISFNTQITDESEYSESDEKALICKWCSRSFHSAVDLYNHSLLHSNARAETVSSKKRTIKKSSKRILHKQMCYLCTICDQVFPVKQLFLQHSNTLHKACEKNVITGSVVNISRVFACNMCDAKYLRFRQLVNHNQECSVTSLNDSKIIKDRRKLWCIPLLKATKYTCDFCNHKFSSSKCLTVHKSGSDIKDQPKNLICEHCGKAFASDCAFKWHTKLHEEGKKFICEMCGKTYNKFASLKQHRINHSYEKLFSCDTCEKTFKTKDLLKNHLRVHTGDRPYTCLTCQKTFKTSGALSKHRKIHLNVRPFSCPICQSSFKTEYNRKTHMLIHTNQKPHVCLCCNSAFRYRKDLIKHVDDVHTVANYQTKSNLNVESIRNMRKETKIS